MLSYRFSHKSKTIDIVMNTVIDIVKLNNDVITHMFTQTLDEIPCRKNFPPRGNPI